jgi:signal transduction histidine kinase
VLGQEQARIVHPAGCRDRHPASVDNPTRRPEGAGIETRLASWALPDRTALFAAVSAIAVAVGEIALDSGTWVALDLASIYPIPLVLAAFTRSRALLWTLMALLAAATFTVYAVQIPAGGFSLEEPLFVNRVLDAIALLLTAGVLHVWMRSLDIREAQARLLAEQNRKLELANSILVAHEAQILRQNEALNQRHQEAEASSGRKTRMLAAVSHDIRTPVHTINLMAELIRRSAEDPSMARKLPGMAQRLQANATSLSALVSDVLDIAHFDSGRVELHETTFSLDELVEAKCRELAPLADARSLRLEARTQSTPLWVRSDRMKLDRMIANLVGNALKFTAEGGVWVSVHVDPDGAPRIDVRDTGRGIAPDQFVRIFEEFSQVGDATDDPGQGWGLGLAICRRLAHALGAKIGVTSEPGRGSEFTVRLPAGCVVDIAPLVLPASKSHRAPAP